MAETKDVGVPATGSQRRRRLEVPTKDPQTGAITVTDPGVSDKRRLVTETELSQALKTIARTGNILSDVIRNAWDGRPLRTLTKHSPTRADTSHISIIGHTTPE